MLESCTNSVTSAGGCRLVQVGAGGCRLVQAGTCTGRSSNWGLWVRTAGPALISVVEDGRARHERYHSLPIYYSVYKRYLFTWVSFAMNIVRVRISLVMNVFGMDMFCHGYLLLWVVFDHRYILRWTFYAMSISRDEHFLAWVSFVFS